MYQPRHTAMKSAYLLRFASGARRHTVGCWSKMSAKELLLAVGIFNARQMFITGGELAPHDLRPLTTLLITSSFSVQLETSGIIAIQVHPCTWVTVNQRSALPGGLTVLDEALTLANEFKRPSTSQSISTNC